MSALPQTAGPSARPRSAFTLLELVIVLALLVVVTAVTAPALMRTYGETRLRRAAETMRVELAGARTLAVEEGVMYQFLYEPGGRRFVSIPAEKDGEPTRFGAASISAATDDHPRRAGQLPDGLAFEKSAVRGEGVSGKLSPELFARLPDADELAALTWSEPVVFQSDGTGAEDDLDELTLGDPAKSIRVKLSVRGLTGRVSVGAVDREGTP